MLSFFFDCFHFRLSCCFSPLIVFHYAGFSYARRCRRCCRYADAAAAFMMSIYFRFRLIFRHYFRHAASRHFHAAFADTLSLMPYTTAAAATLFYAAWRYYIPAIITIFAAIVSLFFRRYFCCAVYYAFIIFFFADDCYVFSYAFMPDFFTLIITFFIIRALFAPARASAPMPCCR